MKFIIIPFHDWRKNEKEGFRTRDAHFIDSLSKQSTVDKILIINRPSTWMEILYKKQNAKIKGNTILKKKTFSLTKVNEKLYVIDSLSYDFFGQLSKKHLWFIEKYGELSYLRFIDMVSEQLDMKGSNLLVQNIFAYKLAEKLNVKSMVFDAWDNFLKFPTYSRYKSELLKSYKTLSAISPKWITNSEENKNIFQDAFKPKNIIVIKNGVSSSFGSKGGFVPEDMLKLPRPIVGFGGKISYLLDTDLINYITRKNPDFSFVFLGQVLDKKVYSRIKKRNNVYFLGDKHYDIYNAYVANFDICIVPYQINENQHGGDSIKVYEYLICNKKVVGTRGNGLSELEEFLFIADTQEEFSQELNNSRNTKPKIDPSTHLWDSKVKNLIAYFN